MCVLSIYESQWGFSVVLDSTDFHYMDKMLLHPFKVQFFKCLLLKLCQVKRILKDKRDHFLNVLLRLIEPLTSRKFSIATKNVQGK